MKATARAHPNIALIKYWGKRDDRLILPHQSSLSVTLGELFATTTVESGHDHDQLSIDGKPMQGGELERVVIVLDAIRARAKVRSGFRVVSRTNFPMSAGLASSAAGFAALAVAGSAAAGLPADLPSLSILARLGSGSACRSIQGGFCEWVRGERDDGFDSFAIQRFPEAHWPDLRLLAVVTHRSAKEVSSRNAMRSAVETSPYYAAWCEDAERSVAMARPLIEARDLALLGPLCERNAWRMHATSLAADPPVCFLRPTTLQIIDRVAALRRDGIPAFFTLDAGPNPVILCTARDAETVERAALESGAVSVTRCSPGPGVELLDEHLF